jgi:hypothetical protein
VTAEQAEDVAITTLESVPDNAPHSPRKSMATRSGLSMRESVRAATIPISCDILANDDRKAAEQAAAIITGKWSDSQIRSNTATSSKRRTQCFRAATPTFLLQVFSSESCR